MSSDDCSAEGSDEGHTRLLQSLLDKLKSNESAMSDLRKNLRYVIRIRSEEKKE